MVETLGKLSWIYISHKAQRNLGFDSMETPTPDDNMWRLTAFGKWMVTLVKSPLAGGEGWIGNRWKH